MIPPFEFNDAYPLGVLPPGIHLSDESEFKELFVDGFPESSTRSSIFAGFLRLRGEAEKLRIRGKQWIGGSFVESKPNPADIDVVTFIHHNDLGALSDEAKEFLLACLDGQESTVESHLCHAFLFASYDEGQPMWPHFEDLCNYWRTFFGHTREYHPDWQDVYPPIPKGFIEMPLGRRDNP